MPQPAPTHDHGADHGHDHGLGLARAGERHRGRLIAAFVVIATFFVVQTIASFATNSLALLFAVAVWVIIEAVRRIGTEPEVLGAPMLVVAVLGLMANLIAFALLRSGAKESINVEGAYLEVLADTVGSVGVILAAILLQAFGWMWVDSVAGVLIGVWILPRTWRLGRRAVRILLQAAPEHLDLDQLADELAAIDGVVAVHDLHVWTLTSEMDAASVHLVTASRADSHAVLDDARHCLAERHGITHGTFRVEPDDHEGCDRVAW